MSHFNLTIYKHDHGHVETSLEIGMRLRSWALPLLVTWTPVLQEIAIGPFYIARSKTIYMPF